jgi:hypothetical protein
MSTVRYDLGFYIPKDGDLRSHLRDGGGRSRIRSAL